MTELTDLLRDVPGWVLIGAFALACGLFLAWCMRGQDWFLEDDDEYVVSSLYEYKKDARR